MAPLKMNERRFIGAFDAQMPGEGFRFLLRAIVLLGLTAEVDMLGPANERLRLFCARRKS